MEKDFKKDDGVSLLSILRLLMKKVNILILAVVIGAIVGGGFAVIKTRNVDYYGTNVEFYVNPENPETSMNDNGSQYGVYGAYGRHVMDNMVKLLTSESFSEQLMLSQNEHDLPEKGINGELDKAIEKAVPYVEELENAKEIYEEKEADEINKLVLLRLDWNEAVAGTAYASYSYSESNYTALKKAEDKGEFTIPEKLTTAYTTYQAAKSATLTAKNELKGKKDLASGPIEDALLLWRATSEYRKELSRVRKAISYSYLEEGESVKDANDLARSFIYVKISVLNDEAFAKDLLEAIKEAVPAYVEENMAVPSGYQGTNCQRISRLDDVRLTNPNYMIKQTVKYAVLAAGIMFVAACIVVVLLDQSDKRLRDHEVIPELFNIPVLGLVPSIDSLESDNNAKKKNAKAKSNKEVK